MKKSIIPEDASDGGEDGGFCARDNGVARERTTRKRCTRCQQTKRTKCASKALGGDGERQKKNARKKLIYRATPERGKSVVSAATRVASNCKTSRWNFYIFNSFIKARVRARRWRSGKERDVWHVDALNARRSRGNLAHPPPPPRPAKKKDSHPFPVLTRKRSAHANTCTDL